MSLHVIYDNARPVSRRIQALIGIEDFGKLIFRRRTLLAWFQSVVKAAGLRPPLEMNGGVDWSHLETRLRNGELSQDMFLVCPSHVVSPSDPSAVSLFLRQARYAPSSMVLPTAGGSDWSGWTLLSSMQLRQYLSKRSEGDPAAFFERNSRDFVRLDEKLGLIDLDDEVALLGFLSGAYDVRFFNSIKQDEYTITKRSTETVKLEREYRFFDMLPPTMQMFFVRPFDFKVEGAVASYRMERLHVPDMALQWLHGALSREEFGRFLDQVFHFVATRTRRHASTKECDHHIEFLFVTKVRDRIAQLKSLPEYGALKPLIERACGDLDALVRRYIEIFQRTRSRLPHDHLVIGHGDLCFSNILYAKTTQLMKLIDPRGANIEAELYSHPYYDIAKLSHSVLGNYDRINHDMFDIQVNESLTLDLVFDRQSPDWAEAMFSERLQAQGLELDLVRLCEASLFISMLPLHVDRPRKVLGFVVNAAARLQRLETSL